MRVPAGVEVAVQGFHLFHLLSSKLEIKHFKVVLNELLRLRLRNRYEVILYGPTDGDLRNCFSVFARQ